MSGVRILSGTVPVTRRLVVLAVLLTCFLALIPVSASADCTVTGGVYDWATFDLVNNAIVEVYSLPNLSLTDQAVTKSGSYSFVLPPGTYMIRASSGTPGTPDEITAVENVTVPETGARTIDLVLFPPDSLDDLTGYVDDNATATPTDSPALSPTPKPQTGGGDMIIYLGAGAILLAIVAIVAGFLFLQSAKPRKPSGPPAARVEPPVVSPPIIPPAMTPAEPANEPPAPEPQPEVQAPPPQPPQQPPQPTAQELLLPQDCREVLAIMEKNGGRITQLDLRKALPYSEAKVSLIVSDLESRGLVKKIKKGRGNVLIMIRPGERPPEN